MIPRWELGGDGSQIAAYEEEVCLGPPIGRLPARRCRSTGFDHICNKVLEVLNSGHRGLRNDATYALDLWMQLCHFIGQSP